MAILYFNKLNLNKKIQAGLGLAIFILILSSVISFYSIRVLITQSEMVNHSNVVILGLENVISTIKDAETSQRGYLLTGNKDFMKIHFGAANRAIIYFDKVKNLTLDSKVQQTYLDSLKPLITQRFFLLEDAIKAFEQAKEVPLTKLGRGRGIMLKIRAIINTMQAEEERILDVRTTEARGYASVVPAIIIVSSLIAIIISGFSLYFISSDIKNREKVQQELSRLNKDLELSNREMEKNKQELDRKNYLLEGANKLNDLIRSESNLNSIGEKILIHFCEFLKAQAGVLYISDDSGRFERISTYSFTSDKEMPDSFKAGEGIIGQAVSQNKRMILENIHPDHVRVASGLSLIQPASLLIEPFCNNNEVVAIAEFLNKDSFSQIDLEYLAIAGNIISISISGIKAENKTRELLSETQNQAEELESQQEELRQINDELREQRDRLQASEEEVRASEEELQEKNTELEHQYEAIRGKNKALEAARQAVLLKVNQLDAVSKYKSDFLANMSHELRTPLNSILILASLLKENKNKHLSVKDVEQAGIIEKSGNDLLKLINEILDLARVESGKIKLEIKSYPIREFNIQNQFEEFAREKNIHFKVSIDPDLPANIKTDRFRLEQVLKNLLSNAFKFTPKKGSVGFSIGYADKGLEFMNPNLNNKKVIAFAVKDTGIGISNEKKDLIFEAFQQADPSTTRKYGGSGLGLTISRDMAQLLGGEIQVKSKPGEGSVFTLYIPEELDEEAESQVVQPEEKVKTTDDIVSSYKLDFPDLNHSESQKSSVLIIEDDSYFSKILSDYAERKGNQVYMSDTGEGGLGLARKFKPDAILLDVQLPDINGWEVLKTLKQDPTLNHIPVHVMSAYDMEGSAVDHGQEGFFSKPMTLEKLDKAFAEISELKRRHLKKVLIVEDNITENHAVKELLSNQQIDTKSAFTGNEALEMIKEEKFDCVILDISLPDMNGYEILQQIKKDAKLSSLPVIIYSGKELSEEEEVRFKKYADTIVIKTEYSYTRLLEEVKLFIHKIGSSLSKRNNYLKNTEEGLQNKKILIADDDIRNIYSLSSVLENSGMRIVVAYDGKQAIEELKANPDTDAILMDVMMPEMDGIEATKLIRSMPDFKDIPIIAITAKVMTGDKEKCLAAGVSDYLSKPININKLLSLLRVWIYKT